MKFELNKPADAPTSGKLLSFGMINALIEGMKAIKERFETTHDYATGKHIYPGAIAFASLWGAGAAAPTVTANTSHNVQLAGGITRLGVGLYRVTLTLTVTNQTPVIVSDRENQHYSAAATSSVAAPTNQIDVQVWDVNTNAAADLAVGEVVQFFVLEVE